MYEITMENLSICFEGAKENHARFVAVKVEMDGFPVPEIIVNPIVNADAKLAYYKKAYSKELKHKYSAGIRIIGFTFGDSMKEIEKDLDY